ncbi:MAG: hypothetical protein GKS06_13635 [Acidobacteria bacterium]|nr:hypothetical protein [Acidobacteriota bacterium]
MVYFGENPGATYRSDALNVEPGFKNPSGDALLCYCFDKRRRDIENELRTSRDSAIAAEIRTAISAQACACEVRNPTGKCCLGAVNAEIDAARLRIKTT